MKITKILLLKMFPKFENLDEHFPYIEEALALYNINTNKRLRMWFAQFAHETANFTKFVEIGSGQQYEGSKILGNSQVGDGAKYKGRGAVMLTGRWNYGYFGTKIKVNLLECPEKAALPKYCWKIAGEFWKYRNLEKYAEAEDVKGATHAINGGYIGLAERQKIYERLSLFFP